VGLGYGQGSLEDCFYIIFTLVRHGAPFVPWVMVVHCGAAWRTLGALGHGLTLRVYEGSGDAGRGPDGYLAAGDVCAMFRRVVLWAWVIRGQGAHRRRQG
jgi:hypothetical protein